MIMERFEDVIAYVRENVMVVVAIVFIALLLFGYLIFGLNTLLPQWAARADLARQLSEAETAMLARTSAQLGAPGELQARVAAEEAALAQAAAVFLTEAQAAQILDQLYQNAAAYNVTITDLQAQPAPASPEKPVYDTRLFRLTAAGRFADLTAFVGAVRSAALQSVLLQNVSIVESELGGMTLTMEMALYTSPFASGETLPVETVEDLPLPPPTAVPATPTTPPATAALVAQLDEQWWAEDWTAVLATIDQIVALDPAYPGMIEKRYAAHVNYGWQLTAAGQAAAARGQFEQALAVQPGGGEALAALQTLSATPTPQPTIYVVQRGDTLFSIARRYGTTADALRAANNLSGNNIHAGLQLVIPQP